MSNRSIRAGWDTERSVTAPFSGSNQNLGSALAHWPAILIFDNQSTVAVQVIVNGAVWKTFVAGEALVLDLRANNGIADNFTTDLSTQFQINGTGGTGIFSLAIIYMRGSNKSF